MTSREIIGNLYRKWIFIILFVSLGDIILTGAHYNAQQYATNFLPTLTRSHLNTRQVLPQHHHQHHNLHYYQQQQHPLHNYHRLQKQQQHVYLKLPFHKKPTSFNYDNIIIYNNKRYKRYPPYQATMPEIPIKKTIGRYLPYNTALYPLNLIHAVTPSILIPLYTQPSKTSTSSKLIFKPTQTQIIQPTIAAIIKNNNINNNNNNNMIPTADPLFYNYLRLFKINNQNNTIATTKSTMPSSTMSSFWHYFYQRNNTTTDSMTTSTDTPFSASNIRQQREDEENDYNNKNNNRPTIFRFPIEQDKTPTTTATTSTALYQTTASTSNIPKSNIKIYQEKINEEQFNFVPTWYPYVQPQTQRQQKHSNFFTIEDAIKPLNAYQPISYNDAQTESSLSVHTGFSPLQDMYHNSYPFSPLPSFRTTTTTTTTSTINPVNLNEHKEETEEVTASTWIDMDLVTTPTIPTKINTIVTEEEEEHDGTKNVNARLRTNIKQQTKTTITKIPKKKSHSLFDDWFGSMTETPTENSTFDIIATTTTAVPPIRKTTTTTSPTTKSHIKLPKYNTKMRRTNKANITKSSPTTQSSITAITTTRATLLNAHSTSETGIGKKSSKKYFTYKNNKDLTKMENLNLTTAITLKGKKKLTKRIKKVIRLRSTLMPLLKLKNNSLNNTKPLEEETKMRKITDEEATKNIKDINYNDNEITFTTPSNAILIATTTLSTTKTTSTTTAMPFKANNDKARGGNRKRGRYTYNNQQNLSILSVDNNSKRNSVKAAIKPEINDNKKLQSKLRIKNSRRYSHAQSTSSTTIEPMSSPSTSSTTTWQRNLANEEHTFKWPATTVESAIMKIANSNDNDNNTKHKKINRILHNLQLSPAQELEVVTGVTEFPPLPIELYFQKMTKASF